MKQIVLRKDEIGFVKDVLERSNSLGKYLIGRLLKDKYIANVLTDKEIPFGHSLDAGGICGKDRSICELISNIQMLLARKDAYAIFVNECALRTDRAVGRYSWPIFIADEVYHGVPSFPHPDQVRASIVDAETGISLVGVIISSQEELMNPRSVARSEQAEHWARTSTKLMLGVYDAETYLILDI